MEPTISIKIGDSVIVKPNIQDPDFGLDIGGWQDRASDVLEDREVVLIEWDSLTLKDLPGSMIASCEEDGLSWNKMYLPTLSGAENLLVLNYMYSSDAVVSKRENKTLKI